MIASPPGQTKLNTVYQTQFPNTPRVLIPVATKVLHRKRPALNGASQCHCGGKKTTWPFDQIVQFVWLRLWQGCLQHEHDSLDASPNGHRPLPEALTMMYHR